MEVRECGVCGSWRRGDLFPSENKREDGTIRYENFVCARCQRDVREWREIERALDDYGSVVGNCRLERSASEGPSGLRIKT
jgi:hypothetical protein